MSNSADAQGRTAETGARLGNLLLATGAALYLVVLVARVAVLGTETQLGARAVAILLAPIAFAAMIFLLMQLAVFVGIISGTPWLSLAYGLSLMKRDWKTIAGVILVLTALCAILAAAIT
jgi:hypothetical protein